MTVPTLGQEIDFERSSGLGGRWYRQGALRRHVYKLEMQQRDAELAEKRKREAEAQRAYDEELQRMLDKAAEPRMPRIAVI